jgi:tetratricopeptide (TPR) repeat protein
MVRERMQELQKNIRERVLFSLVFAKVPNNIRGHNKNFVGRSQELAKLRDKLTKYEKVSICAVNGVAGIGKSSLAREYAYIYRQEYLGGQFEVDLSKINTIEGLQDQLVDLARNYLNADIPLNLADEKQRDNARERAKAAFEQMPEKIRSLYEQRPEITKVLLILDNLNEESTGLVGAANLHKLPSAERVHLLITTRADPGSLGNLENVALDILPPEDALKLLFRHREFARRENDPDYLKAKEGNYPLAELDELPDQLPPDEEWKAALAIVHRLGRHALAISLVAAYLGSNPLISYGQYAKELAKHGIGQALSIAGNDEKVRNLIQHPETLIGPLFEGSVARLSPLALRTLEYAAFLPADQVPLAWLERLVRQDEEMTAALQPENFKGPPWEGTLQTLDRLQYLVGRPLARMHRVLQEVVKQRMTDAQRNRLSRAVQGQAKEAASLAELDVPTAGARQGFAPLVTYALQLASEKDPDAIGTAVKVLPVATRFARISFRTGNYDQALREYHQIENIARGANDRKQLAFALLEQAKILDQRRLPGALPLYEQAEAVYRELDDPDNLQLCLFNRANIHHNRRDYALALPLYQQAEEIAAKAGLKEPLRLSLYNQTQIHKANKNYDQALALLERQCQLCRELGQGERLALAIEEQASIHNARQQFDACLERYQALEQLCRQLDLKDKNLLLRALTNQALIQRTKGDFPKALELLSQHESICRQELEALKAKGDAAVAQFWQALQGVLFDRADTYYRKGELDTALAILEEQEKVCREAKLYDGLQRGLGSRAVIYRRQNNPQGALELLREQMAVCRDSKNNVGLQFCLHQQAEILLTFPEPDFELASAYLQEEEGLCRELKLWDQLQACLHARAWGLQNIRKESEEALAVWQEQVRICEQHNLKHGLEVSLRSQALAHKGLGHIDDALRCFSRHEEVCRELGLHDLLQKVLQEQANLLFWQGKLDQSLAKYQEQERICRQHGFKAGLQVALDGHVLIHHNRQQWDAVLSRSDELEALCRELKMDSGLYRCLYFRAGAHRGRGEYELALDGFRRLEQLCPRDPPTVILGNCFNDHAALVQQVGTLTEARELYEQAVELGRLLNDPAPLAWRLLNLASVLRGLGKAEEAEAAFNEADQTFADQEKLAQDQQVRTAAASFSHARGEVARLREQWDTALVYYTAAIAQDPVNLPFTYHSRGQVRANLGDQDGAIQDYTSGIERARQLKLDDNNIVLDRGWSYFEAKQDQEARNDFQSALQAQPNSANAFLNFGNFLVNTGNFAGGHEQYDKAIALTPKWSNVFEARALARIYLRDFPGAFNDINNAIHLNDQVANYYDVRAWIGIRQANSHPELNRTQEWQQIAADCEKTIALDRKHGDAYSNLAMARLWLGELPQATEALHRLLDIYLANPPDKAGRRRSANIGWSAAAEDWTVAIGEPPTGTAYLGLGIAEWIAGKIEPAIQHLERAIELGLANRTDAEQVLSLLRSEKAAKDLPPNV